jgi:hypothetical protein
MGSGWFAATHTRERGMRPLVEANMTCTLRRLSLGKLAVLSLPLFLMGCFEYAEDVYVHADGSGRIKIDRSYASGMLDEDDIAGMRDELEETKAELEELEQVTRVDIDDFKDDDMYHFVFDIHVKDYKFLSKLLEYEEESHADMEGHRAFASSTSGIQFQELEDGQIRYRRVLDPAAAQSRARNQRATTSAQAGDGEDPATEMFKDKFFTYRFHAPTINSGDETTSEVEWKFPVMPQTEDEEPPAVLEATFSMKSGSSLLWVLIGGGVFILFALGWLKGKWDRRWM